MWPTPALDDATAGAPITSNAALLEHLAARLLDAPGGACARVARAVRILRGVVTRSDVIAGPGDTNLGIVEVGDGHATATGVWVLPREMTSLTVTLPLEGAAGYALLEALPAELAPIVPAAYLLAPSRPLLLPDDDAVAAALACRVEALRHLAGGPLQILLGGLVRRGDAAALRAFVVDGAPGAEALLARAALARLGDPGAERALDVDELAQTVFDYLGLVTFHADDGRLGVLRVPPRDTPLPWEPHVR